MDAVEAINSLRACRHFLPKPVEPEKIRQILEAASKAPSSSNSQPWHFIIIQEPRLKARIKEPISRAWHRMLRGRPLPPEIRKIYDDATKLVDNTDKVPALILAGIDTRTSSRSPESMYGSVYPAVQNLLLAAHSLGLGTCLTTHGSTPTRGGAEVKKILGIPDYIKIASMIYLGYPAKKLKPPRRKPLEAFTHYDAW